MKTAQCSAPECTVAQTNLCMKGYQSPELCPESTSFAVESYGGAGQPVEAHEQEGTDSDFLEELTATAPGDAVLPPPTTSATALPRTGTLSIEAAGKLMQKRYVSLVAILGLPDAGKTACIASLYLLLAHQRLRGYSYSDSETLMALDEISRGARSWNAGQAPEQMTTRTEISDARQAGFLHLRLKRNRDGRKFDLLMPDLPGEWTTSLINNSEIERFEFVKSAEVVWIMVDGRQFADSKTRQRAEHTLTNLIERLSPLLSSSHQVVLVSTWRDQQVLPPASLLRIQKTALSFGLKLVLVPIASFSNDGEVVPGEGLSELIDITLSRKGIAPDPWPDFAPSASGRAFANYRRHP